MSLYDLLPSFHIAAEPSPLDPDRPPANTSIPSRHLKRLSLAPSLSTSSLSPPITLDTSLWRERKRESISSDDRPASVSTRSPDRQSQPTKEGESENESAMQDTHRWSLGLAPVSEDVYVPKTPGTAKRQRRRPQSIIVGRPSRGPSSIEGGTDEPDTTYSLARLQPRPHSLTGGHAIPTGGPGGSNPYISTPVTLVLASVPTIEESAHSRFESLRRASHDRPLTVAEEHGDLLRAIAQKEAKVNVARQDLEQQERELDALKARWAAVISRSDQHSTTSTRIPVTHHVRKPSIIPVPSSNRPQPANAARLLPSPARSQPQAHPLTRTASSTSTTSNVSSHSITTHTSLQSLQSASHTASTLVNQGLATMGMGDLAQLTSGAAGGKVVEGGRRFVGHMWDALQGVAEGVVMASPGQGVESEYARSEQQRESKTDRVSPTTPTSRLPSGDSTDASRHGDVGKTVGRIRQTSFTASRQLLQGRPSDQSGSSHPDHAISSPPRRNLPTTGTIRNMRSLSLVSSSTERAMDTALADNLVDLVAGEGLGDKLEGLGFVPLSPKKASPRRGRVGSGSDDAGQAGGTSTAHLDLGSWTSRITNAISSPNGRKRLSGSLFTEVGRVREPVEDEAPESSTFEAA